MSAFTHLSAHGFKPFEAFFWIHAQNFVARRCLLVCSTQHISLQFHFAIFVKTVPAHTCKLSARKQAFTTAVTKRKEKMSPGLQPPEAEGIVVGALPWMANLCPGTFFVSFGICNLHITCSLPVNWMGPFQFQFSHASVPPQCTSAVTIVPSISTSVA